MKKACEGDLKKNVKPWIQFPAADPLPNDPQDRNMDYFFIGDDAFAIKTWMMKPYSEQLSRDKRIFNYRLSRARRVVENAFGILANRFRVFLGTMNLHPDVVVQVIRACICLHNFLREKHPSESFSALEREVNLEGGDYKVIPGRWRDRFNLLDVSKINSSNRQTKAGKDQRDYLCAYYNSSAGSVPWQDQAIEMNPYPGAAQAMDDDDDQV